MPKMFGYLVLIVLIGGVTYGLWITFGPWLFAVLLGLLVLVSAVPLVVEAITAERVRRAARQKRQAEEHAAVAKRTAELEARLGIGGNSERLVTRCPICGHTCEHWEPGPPDQRAA
jgi:ABC-type protease/lipase transport system fused ATPase/permease subunit